MLGAPQSAKLGLLWMLCGYLSTAYLARARMDLHGAHAMGGKQSWKTLPCTLVTSDVRRSGDQQLQQVQDNLRSRAVLVQGLGQ